MNNLDSQIYFTTLAEDNKILFSTQSFNENNIATYNNLTPLGYSTVGYDPFATSLPTEEIAIKKPSRRKKQEAVIADNDEECVINIKELADYYASMEFEKSHSDKCMIENIDLFNTLLYKHIDIIKTYKKSINE